MLAPASPAVRSPMSVLVTGFDPFGGSAVNPSWDAIHALDGREIAGHRIIGGEIPTLFGASLQRLEVNVDDARIPDNAGARPIDVPIVPEGPAAYFTSLPIKAMLQALLE